MICKECRQREKKNCVEKQLEIKIKCNMISLVVKIYPSILFIYLDFSNSYFTCINSTGTRRAKLSYKPNTNCTDAFKVDGHAQSY